MEQTDHGQINCLTTVMCCVVDVVVDLVVGFSVEMAEAAARMVEELRAAATSVSRVKGSTPRRRR